MAKMVVFKLGEELYGARAEEVREIMPCTGSPVTSVPGTPSFFEGFINARGELVSLVNLRRFVGMENDPVKMESSRILLLASEKGEVQGVLVDDVTSISEVCIEELQPIEENRSGEGIPKRLLRGVAETQEGLVVMLDVEKLVTEGDVSEEEKPVVG